MEHPVIKRENVATLLTTPFINVFDLQYAPGKHYYDATRRRKEDLLATMPDKEYASLIPDAVTICVILKNGLEEKLLTFYEYRYVSGRFLLSPPAGLIDKDDKLYPDCYKRASIRELYEETGLTFHEETDSFRMINTGLFSSPGMTDETSAVSLLVLNEPDLSKLNFNNITGSELFDSFYLLDKKEASELLKSGKDHYGGSYSAFTWICLMYFVSDMWK